MTGELVRITLVEDWGGFSADEEIAVDLVRANTLIDAGLAVRGPEPVVEKARFRAGPRRRSRTILRDEHDDSERPSDASEDGTPE